MQWSTNCSVREKNHIWEQGLLYFCAIVTISQGHDLRGEIIFWFMVSGYQDKEGVADQLSL